MTSTTEEYEDFFEESSSDETSTRDPYYRMEEHLKEVHLKIVDYLAQEGRRDLFCDLTLTDVAAMIYNPNCVREVIRDHPDSLL
jgi:hypothetical protein